MRFTLANFLSSGETSLVVLGGIAVVALGAWSVRWYLNSRPTAAELERRRRVALNSRGKMGDANLLDYRDHVVFYSYDVGGAEYTACQDLTGLESLLPTDRWSAIGPVSIK